MDYKPWSAMTIQEKKFSKGYRLVRCPLCGNQYLGKYFEKVVFCGLCKNEGILTMTGKKEEI